MPTNDDLVLGAGNSANDPTVIFASTDEDGNASFTAGRAVFEAGEAESGPLVFIGLLGRGSQGNDYYKRAPMPGVVGYGGRFDGDESAGSGVVGTGGDTAGNQPGAGVYGLGGPNTQPASGTQFGAGVVGVSGGLFRNGALPTYDQPPPPADTGNVGVYGESQFGPGVRGNGGDTQIGVDGRALGAPGVNGTSKTVSGVHGESEAGPGVSGVSGAGDGVVGSRKPAAAVCSKAETRIGRVRSCASCRLTATTWRTADGSATCMFA